MRIFIEDSFDAAHWLPNVPSTHKCGRMHGHTYRVHLEITGPIDPYTGWIVDYGDVKPHWEAVKAHLDHRTLNDIEELKNPTVENIVQYIWREMKENVPGLARIELRETEHCGVVYEG